METLQKLVMKHELKQALHIAQAIDLSNLLSIPDEVINTVASVITNNPNNIETILQNTKSEREGNYVQGSASKVQTLYASFNSLGIEPEKRRTLSGGFIVSPKLSVLETSLGNIQTTLTPDVTYIGRSKQKPELVFSDHLKDTIGLFMLQIDQGQYPETARLLSQLKKFEDWKRRTLREVYTIIGEEQREFFGTHDVTRLNTFSQSNLADKLTIHESTASRIVRNRWVESRNLEGDQKFIYTKDLLVTNDDVLRFNSVVGLNKILREEYKRGEAYSDQELSEKLPRIARRTLAKYRLALGIPNSRERDQAYKSGKMEKTFEIPQLI